MQHAKCLRFSEKNNFGVCHHMYKLIRSLKGDATYQMSKLYAIQFQRRRILNFALFVPMFKLVDPWAGPVLTPGAPYEQT